MFSNSKSTMQKANTCFFLLFVVKNATLGVMRGTQRFHDVCVLLLQSYYFFFCFFSLRAFMLLFSPCRKAKSCRFLFFSIFKLYTIKKNNKAKQRVAKTPHNKVKLNKNETKWYNNSRTSALHTKSNYNAMKRNVKKSSIKNCTQVSKGEMKEECNLNAKNKQTKTLKNDSRSTSLMFAIRGVAEYQRKERKYNCF